MINLMFFSLLFFFIFGVFGVSQFKGAFYSCDFDHIEQNLIQFVIGKHTCMDYGGDWL